MNRAQKERLSQFVGITGADSGVAQRCLEAAGWSVEAAIEIFYSSGMHMQAARSGGGSRLDRCARCLGATRRAAAVGCSSCLGAGRCLATGLKPPRFQDHPATQPAAHSIWLAPPNMRSETCVLSATRPCRDAISRLFQRYRDTDTDEEVVGVEGIQAMCEDLGVQPDDIVVLVLRWGLPLGWWCCGRRGGRIVAG